MFLNRSSRFSPKVQGAILVVLLVLHLIGVWWFIDAMMAPDKAEPWRFYAGTMLASTGAEPWGVMIAWALSRRNDT